VSVLLRIMANSLDTPDLDPADWERIARYLSGEADGAESRATEKWLEEDSRRSEAAQTMRKVLASTPVDDARPIDVEGALKKVKGRFDPAGVIPFRQKPRVASTRPSYLRVAAVVIVLLGGALTWRLTHPTSESRGGESFATAVGERKQLTLGDGSSVVLGPASSLRFSSTNGGPRSAELTGAAYFKVVHDGRHPFVVTISRTTVRDVGTAFAVHSADSGYVSVEVDTGSVVVGLVGSDDRDGPVLAARDRAVVSGGAVTVERGVASPDDFAWTQGRLVFRDTPLIEVGAELYRWYGVRLRVANSSLAKLHLTASFSDEPVERVLEVIALTLGAKVQRRGDVAVLYTGASPEAPR